KAAEGEPILGGIPAVKLEMLMVGTGSNGYLFVIYESDLNEEDGAVPVYEFEVTPVYPYALEPIRGTSSNRVRVVNSSSSSFSFISSLSSQSSSLSSNSSSSVSSNSREV